MGRSVNKSFFWAAPARNRRSTSCAQAQSSTCRSPPANVTVTSTVIGRNAQSGTTWSASSGSPRSCATTFAKGRGSTSRAHCGRAPGRPADRQRRYRSEIVVTEVSLLSPPPDAAVTTWSTTSVAGLRAA